MESLSIKKTGKVFLAVALVIFMLVALLGLSVFGHTSAFASAAAADDVVITAAFTAESHAAHSDSTSSKRYYNQDSTGSYYLVPNTDTFTVTYSFEILASRFIGFTALNLANEGFSIESVKVNNVEIGNKGTTTVSGVIYTYGDTLGIDGGGAYVTAVTPVVVVYKLTSAISTYANKTIGLTGTYDKRGAVLQDVSSNTVGVYVRSTASITTTDPSKTYDSTAVTTSTTFTPAVSDTGNESRRSAIVTTWSTGSAPINAGDDYNVAVSTAANDYYEATAYNTDFDIDPKAVTLTAVNKTTEHGDALATLTWTGDSGFYAADGVSVSASTTAATTGSNSNVGTYPITLATSATPTSGYAGLANYDITYEHAQTSGDYGVYTITRKFIAVPTVTIYNDGATTGTTISVAGSEDVNYNGLVYSFNYAAASDNAYSGVASPAASKDVGTYVLTLTIGSNYRWGATVDAAEDLTDKVFTYVVKKVDLHVSLDHAAITYRDAKPTSGFSISLPTAAVGGETVAGISLTQGDFNTAYSQGNPVGTYAITLTDESDTDEAIKDHFSNYNVIYDTAGKLSVGKLTVTADGTWVTYKSGDSATMTYDAAAHGIEAVATGYTFGGTQICNVALTGGDNSNGTQTHVSGDEASVTLTATFTLKGDSAEDDYENVITENYTLAEGVQTKNITITRKAINVTANPKTITYGDAFANDGVTYGTFAGSETSAVLTGTLAYATDYVAEAENAKRVVGTYYIRPSGLSNNDYAITFVDGTLTVSKKTVSITWSATKTWVYDAGEHTITATIGDTEYSESITVTVYGGTASATNVGDYTRSVTTLSDMANYALPADVDEDYSITKAPITITITPAEDLVYTSAEKTVFTVTVSGMIGTETLTYTFDGANIKEADGTFTLSNASKTFTGMLAQSYGLELTAVANGTGLIGNYEYTLPDAAANTIAKATFTPGAISYSGATVSWAAVTGVQGSDSITFTYTVNKGATEKQSSTSSMSYTASATGDDYVLAISFAGDRAANYNAIADQDLLEVFSVTFTDTASEHTSESTVFEDVVYYAFSGQTVAAHDAWSLQNYTWEGWKYTPSSEEITYDAPALSASLTVRATWAIKTVTVTYKYKLAGTAASTYKTYKTETIYANADLTAVPTVAKWFRASAWNDAEALDGNTKTNVYYATYASERTFYTEFTFIVKNGDIDGNGTVTTADATLYRQKNAGGYAVKDHIVETIAAAWAIVDNCTGAGTFSDSWWAEGTYFLTPVADVNGDGSYSVSDVMQIAAAKIDNSDFAAIEDGAVVNKIESADVSGDKEFSLIPASPTSVTVAGETATYSYADNKVTLNTALTSGQKLVIIVNGVKYVYTKA